MKILTVRSCSEQTYTPASFIADIDSIDKFKAKSGFELFNDQALSFFKTLSNGVEVNNELLSGGILIKNYRTAKGSFVPVTSKSIVKSILESFGETVNVNDFLTAWQNVCDKSGKRSALVTPESACQINGKVMIEEYSFKAQKFHEVRSISGIFAKIAVGNQIKTSDTKSTFDKIRRDLTIVDDEVFELLRATKADIGIDDFCFFVATNCDFSDSGKANSDLKSIVFKENIKNDNDVASPSEIFSASDYFYGFKDNFLAAITISDPSLIRFNYTPKVVEEKKHRFNH